jgi:polyribonucleotide nucleotidyltransferase
MLKKERENIDMPSLAGDLFSNLDDTETYTTYYVYIVKEEDTIDKIMTKYGVTKEDLEAYNDISTIKPGDKVTVKVYEIDDQGRINLITKELDDIKEERKAREKNKEEE